VRDPLHTDLCELLGCRYPVIQTAMGWIASPELVAANCNAGAFGFLACAVMTPAEAEAAIRRTKALTDRPFGVNFHMFQPGAGEIVALVIEHGVAAVSYGRGPDAALIKRFRDAGVRCIPTVGALRHALKAAELGADAVVVQGSEGGGHTGSVATTILLPQVLDALDIPVVAAGGFSDGRGLAAALAYGASGIAMGTRFLMTQESPVPATTKDSYLRAAAEQIQVSTRVDGMPQRMIMNRALADIARSSAPGMLLRALRYGLRYRGQTGESIGSLLRSAWAMRKANGLSLGQTMMSANAPMLIQQAVVDGDADGGILPSGQVAGNIGDLPDCASLIESIVSGARSRLQALATGGPGGTDNTESIAHGV
jgi:NAD(P)H-dependent flavin oxidoreductase YrpB (nitropropane dioxygenase family)